MSEGDHVVCDPLPPRKPKSVTVTPTFLSDNRPADGVLAVKLTDELVLTESDAPTMAHHQGGAQYYISVDGKLLPLHSEVRITK
jgi:hypothetical protein